MNGKSKIQHQIITVKIFGADIAWDGNGCLIESNCLKKFVSDKASNIQSFVYATGLLKDKCSTFIRFAREGATIEVNISSHNEFLSGYENNFALIGKELHSRFLKHQKSLEERSNPVANSQSEETSPIKSKNDRAAEDALAKLISGTSGAKMEIGFYDSGRENVHSTKSRPTPAPPKALNHNAEEKVTGDVKLFNEDSQKVVLFNLLGILGQVTLDVDSQQGRKTLLDAQKERRQVTLKYTPAKMQHGEQARAGKMISIEAVGDARENLL